ncbi:MAG: KH domain-containing protein [Clostridia bacterium]|nr:KH domain-containing protein [Clostridia bacterium]
MKEILELIITSLVDDKNSVSIEEIEEEKSITYKVKVSKDDMGKVIGKQGRVARSIRTVMKSVSAKEGKKVNIEFVD